MIPTDFRADQMAVRVFDTNAQLGEAAAADFAALVSDAVAARGAASVILATGNSQRTFMNALSQHPDIPWDRISVFHMDEYLGMSEQHPASFSRWIRAEIADRFHPRAFYGIRGDAPDPQAELERYAALLREHKPDICVLGIGENGHLAFNDPPANFETHELIHIVNLDLACRSQQVGEGHFATVDDVPAQAYSLTIPALLQAAYVLALVPEARKAQAVRAALEGPVTEQVPASILRTKAQVTLYLDRDSASLLSQ